MNGPPITAKRVQRWGFNMPFGLSPLLVALMISGAANLFLGNRWLSARDDVVTAQDATKSANQVATECSDGVTKLQKDADDRAKTAEVGRKVAEAAARTAQSKANKLLSAPPSVPGDACASAQAQVNDWLATRGAK